MPFETEFIEKMSTLNDPKEIRDLLSECSQKITNEKRDFNCIAPVLTMALKKSKEIIEVIGSDVLPKNIQLGHMQSNQKNVDCLIDQLYDAMLLKNKCIEGLLLIQIMKL